MEVNESNFKEFTGEKGRLVVLDFWAEWCGPCRMLAQMFGIVSIPTLVFMKNGKIIKKSVGYLDADGLRAVLDGLI